MKFSMLSGEPFSLMLSGGERHTKWRATTYQPRLVLSQLHGERSGPHFICLWFRMDWSNRSGRHKKHGFKTLYRQLNLKRTFQWWRDNDYSVYYICIGTEKSDAKWLIKLCSSDHMQMEVERQQKRKQAN